MNRYGVVAPSHMTYENLRNMNSEENFENTLTYSIDGLANWSESIPLWIRSITELQLPVIWMVSDWSFNNVDIYELAKLKENQLFLPGARGTKNNITPELRTVENARFLVQHTLRVIDYIISEFPNIKLVFWCLYMRTKCRKSVTYPEDCGYDAMRRRYPRNAVDIDSYLRNGVSFEDCISDEGGHPNSFGYSLLREIFERKTAREFGSS